MARLQTLLALHDPFAGGTPPASRPVDPHPADEPQFTTAVTYPSSRRKGAEARAWWYDASTLDLVRGIGNRGYNIRDSRQFS